MLRTLFATAIVLVTLAHAHAATVAVPENVGPWGLRADLPLGERGIYADLAGAIAARTHVPIEVKFVPYGRMLQGVQSGELDYAFGVVSPTTGNGAPFTAIVGRVPMVAVARKGLQLKALSDLHGLSEIGYLRGGSCGVVVDADVAIHRVAQDSYVTAIRKLIAGRLDGWCSIKAGFAYTLRAMAAEDQIGDQLEYGEVQIGFQVAGDKVGSPEAQELTAVVEGLVQDGVAGRIFTHYLGAPYPP
jgi:ABC-type amino acid transport substrate-binding protein